MSHLGRWLSALVDGELDGAERDRVLNHIAGCEACRQEASAMRTLKRRLTALGETSAESAIAGRLIELARSDQAAPAGQVHGSPRVRTSHLGLADERGVRQIRQGLRMAAGSAGSALLAIGVIAFLLGNTGSQPLVPKVTPSVDSYLLQHTYDAGQAPAGSQPVTGAALAGQGRHGAGLAGSELPSPQQSGQRLAILVGPASPGPVTSAAARPGPVTSAAARPGPVTSAAASQAVPTSGPVRRPPGTHAASRNSR